MEFKKHRSRWFRHLLSVPFIYSVLFPIALLDIFIEIYHRICFPLYGLALVKRSDFVVIDRHKLRYLTYMERANCLYCGYANGIMRYATEIAARTEGYWCGIKHQNMQPHQKGFLEYGDEEGYKKKFCKKTKKK